MRTSDFIADYMSARGIKARPAYGNPVFPPPNYMDGVDADMTLRAYAAITMRVPDSGIDWLDNMIRERNAWAELIELIEKAGAIVKARG